jgi:hypothetical protein
MEAPAHHPASRFRAPWQGSRGRRRDGLRRTRRTGALALAAALMLAVVYYLQEAATEPGAAIRGELLAAAGELSAQIVADPTEPVRQAMRWHFREAEVEVDSARSWPNVLVTIRGLDRAACETAVRDARRMEGLVVVSLDAYRSAADCRGRNDMTWWIMP